MSNRKKIVWRNVAVRPMIYGVVFVGVSSKLAVDKAGEYQTWHQLQQEQVTTEATILGNQTLMSSSGELIGHELTYEFVAPGSGSGLPYSSAEVQAQLQEQFFEGSSDFSIDEEKLSSALPEGQQFVRGAQLVKPKDYRSLDTSRPINVIYAASTPENSAIANTSAGPSLMPTLLVLLFFSGGLWFLWQGVKRCFNPPTVTEVSLTQPATIEFSRRQR